MFDPAGICCAHSPMASLHCSPCSPQLASLPYILSYFDLVLEILGRKVTEHIPDPGSDRPRESPLLPPRTSRTDGCNPSRPSCETRRHRASFLPRMSETTESGPGPVMSPLSSPQEPSIPIVQSLLEALAWTGNSHPNLPWRQGVKHSGISGGARPGI